MPTDVASPLSDVIRTRVAELLTSLSGERIEGLHPFILREVERALLATVLEHTGGRKEEAAKILGLHRNSLRLRLVAVGLEQSRKARSRRTR